MPPLDLGWALEDRFRELPPSFYTSQPAEKVGEDPILVHASGSAASLVDLDPAIFTHPDVARIFSGHLPVPGFQPLATVYSGHQFGSYVPQLGDGRALLIAQLRNAAGELWDVQLKGAGRTPYSRFADGRAVLRSSVREYLGSESMAALGIPTTRAFALVATREGVAREQVEPGAVVTRLAPSFIRFGHFEFLHHNQRPDDVRLLADHVIENYFPHLADREDRHIAWFDEVVRRTAHMIAGWQSVGFAHGVMNTDNMSILGLTIDYGPFGYLDDYDPNFICNHSDEGGRYAFGQQPRIGLWNLRALATALTTLIPTETLVESLGRYEAAFVGQLIPAMRAKLGLLSAEENDPPLANALLGLMAKAQADYTLTFRKLARIADGGEGEWMALFPPFAQEAAQEWLAMYRARIASEDAGRRRALMDSTNPKFVLRNWLAETAIRAAEDRGDIAPLNRIFQVLRTPFDEHPGDEDLAGPPPPSMRDLSVSCSS